MPAGSTSPSTAQTLSRLPLGSLNSPSATNSPVTLVPTSSANSRCAASSGSSPSSNRPLGIDQAPSSFFAQNGPPGWTRKISTAMSRRRNSSSPALFSGTGDARDDEIALDGEAVPFVHRDLAVEDQRVGPGVAGRFREVDAAAVVFRIEVAIDETRLGV